MLTDYRYPGSRSFQDTDLDRKLFFGRDAEKDELLHLILAEKLVVLFAKSGMGKTSLLNAGVLQPLREQGFLPCTIRFNDPAFTPLQTVFTGMKDQLTGLQGIEFRPGPETSLWEYFKTAEFWSADDTLLTPALILDQFEDFFDFHATETRRAYITQLADLVKGRMPHTIKDAALYTDIPPDVKIVIALREDYVGQLDELSRDIPEILDNRFRLTALQRQYAHEAIVQPAQVQDEHITTPKFSYAPDAINAILDFLCTRKERDKTIATDEVEPFQLQLLCQHLETKVQQQQKQTVQQSDLGGEKGMQKVLQNFYDRQIKRIAAGKRRRVRKLCEKGLLSRSNRRLSLEEEDITRRFKVKKPLLNDLVNNRLLRAEPRVGSVYYELCHDTMVAPIRKSSARHKLKTRATTLICLLVVLGGGLFGGMAVMRHYSRSRLVTMLLTSVEQLMARGYNRAGDYLTWDTWQTDGAETQYRKAVELDPKFSGAQASLGNILYNQGKYEEALLHIQKAIELDPKAGWLYRLAGDILRAQEKYTEAISHYQQALALDAKDVRAYQNLGKTLTIQGNYTEAIRQYQKAIDINPKNASAYVELGTALHIQGRLAEAISQYRQAIAIDAKGSDTYYALGFALIAQGKAAEAIAEYQNILKTDPKNSEIYFCLGRMFEMQGNYVEETAQFRQALAHQPKYAPWYVWVGRALSHHGQFTEAITYYQKALAIDDWVFPREELGHAFKSQGKFPEAIAQYQKALEIDPNRTVVYNQLGNVAYLQGKFAEAQQFYRQEYELRMRDFQKNRHYLGLKASLAICSLYVEQVEQAFGLAADVIHKQVSLPATRLQLRFVMVTALLYQQKQTEALAELQALFDDYRALTAYGEKWCDYEALHNVIEMSEKLTDADKTLLLKLIDLLEAPKAEGAPKLKELETALPELLQPSR